MDWQDWYSVIAYNLIMGQIDCHPFRCVISLSITAWWYSQVGAVVGSGVITKKKQS